MTALKMTVDDALERADDWTQGLTLHPLSDGLRVGILVLATEVRRLRVVITEHNAGLAAECAAREAAGSPCARYRAIRPGKRCPDCPRDGEVEQ